VRQATERGRRLDRAFDEAARELDPRERAFAHELAYGVTRMRGRLDWLIAPHVHRGMEALEPTVLELLRLGAYQILYMGSVPRYAAVSETVDQARRAAGDRPAGLVNAVLRRVAEGGDGPGNFPSPEADVATFLASWGSHPQWLVDRWLARWSASEVRALVEADNARPDLVLNPLDASAEETVRVLENEAGIDAEAIGGGTGCVRLAAGTSPTAALAALPRAIIQDPGAALVARYADLPPGMKVADLCSAPGGKVLAASRSPVYTLASDRSESRIAMVRDNARRTGRAMGLVVADARHPPIREADVVLLDVPCTGTGTLARHPDARWRLRPGDLDALTRLQDEMLTAGAEVVADGGLLVYSTCSLEPEENADRVDALLSGRPDFSIESTSAVPERYVDARGFLEVTPHAHGFDGAFAARLRKVG
jgi:16S rRNA (cytosine967-C5)-methyltransferase